MVVKKRGIFAGIGPGNDWRIAQTGSKLTFSRYPLRAGGIRLFVTPESHSPVDFRVNQGDRFFDINKGVLQKSHFF